MCCLISVFFTTVKRINFFTYKGSTFIRIHRTLPVAENFPFYAQELHRVPNRTGIVCTPIWSVTLSQLDPMYPPPLLLWAGCRSPALSHIIWKPGEALNKKQMAETAQNAAFQQLKGIKVRESQLLCHKALHPSAMCLEGHKVLCYEHRGDGIHQSRIQTRKMLMEAQR